MAVKSITCQGTYGSKYILYMEYNLISQNIANNTSRIRLRMYAQSTSSQYHAYNLNPDANSYRIKVDDITKVSGTKAMDFRNRKIVELGTWEGNIMHNSDGTKTITIEGSFSISGTSSLSGGYISFTWRLPTIPRASDVSVPSSANFGATITITHTRKSSSFTITLRYKLGNASGTIANKVARDITSWTIPNTLMNQIPNATSGNITIYCDTYNGSTLIGTKSTTIKTNVPSSVVPTFSGLKHEEQNSTVAALNLGKYIQGLSQIKFTIAGASGVYGSTIKTYRIEFEDKTYTSSSATATPTGTGSLTVKATITDSRGRSTSKTVTINVLAYAPPRLDSYSTRRIDGTNIRVSYGIVVKQLEGKNTCTVTIKTKERSQTSWTTARTVDIELTSEEITGTSTLQDYDITKSFDIRIEVKDKFNTTIAETSVSTDFVVMSLSPTGVGIGKIWEAGALDIGGHTRIRDNGNLLYLIGQGHGYLSFYPRGEVEGRKAWIGFDSDNSPHLQMINEDDGDIHIKATNGNVFLNDINVLSVLNSALKDTGTTLNSETIDWDTLEPGIYRVSCLGINAPTDVYNYGMLLVTQTSTGVFQLYIPHSLSSVIDKPYFRIKYDTSDWRDWMPLASGLLPELVVFTRDGTTGGSQTVPLSSGRVPSAIICFVSVQNPWTNYASWSMWANGTQRSIYSTDDLFVPTSSFINIGPREGNKMVAEVNTVTATGVSISWIKHGNGISGTITGYLLALYN